MSENEHYDFTITVHSYSNVVDEFRKKNNLSFKQVEELLRIVLQTNAWADAYEGMQQYHDWINSPQGKAHIESQVKHRRRTA